MRWCLFVAAAPWLAAPLLAQAPVITPAGDPSVRSDTIYRLAVSPADHPDESFVFLLDDGVVVHEADGRGRSTYRQVIQILTREAAERWGEHTFSYVDKRERLTVNWVRVVGLDGKVISDGPTHEQETSAPVPMQYPVYTDTKIRRVTLGGVAPGTIVDFSYTTEVLEPVMPKSFGNSWSVTTGTAVRRSRLIVDVPASLTPRIQERNVRFSRETHTERGRRVHVWATRDVPVNDPEPFAAWPNDLDVSVTVGSPITWDDIARWYWGLARDRYAVTPDLEQVFRLATAGARTRADSLRALYRWVAQEIRYVSLSLGRGGYQPRLATDVIRTKLGDCKDKATLLIALAARMNVTAYPVIVSLAGRPDSAIPTPGAFDHVIVAVDEDGKRTFADPTAELAPFGELAPGLQGEFGLLVHQDGHGELLTLPETPPSANGSATVLRGELGTDGSFTGHYSQTVSGSAQYQLRESLSSVGNLTASERERMTRALAGGVFEGASGDSLSVFDGRDLDAVPRISLKINAARAATRSGPDYIFKLPIPSYPLSQLVAELESRSSRRYPIDVEELFGPSTIEWALEVVVPEGWRARLPSSVDAPSRFGSYRSTYAQDGRTLRAERRVTGRRGVEPPERIGELITWLKAIAADDVPYIVFEAAR
jgi:transglutaminase-like putative cysteine protease